MNPRLLNVQKRLFEGMTSYGKGNFIITDSSGKNLQNKTQYYKKAQEAAFRTKQLKDRVLTWVPINYQGSVIAVCGLKEKGKDLDAQIKLIYGFLDEIDQDEYLEIEFQKSLDQKSLFIKNLLGDKQNTNFDLIIDRGDILGLNLRFPQAIILIEIPNLNRFLHQKYKNNGNDIESKIQQERQNIIEKYKKIYDNNDQNIFTFIDENSIVCLKWSEGTISTSSSVKFFKKSSQYIFEQTHKITGIIPTIGVGQYYPGMPGLRKSYNDAQIALEIGKSIWGKNRVYHILDIGMLVSISKQVSFERKCELALQILGPVINDPALNKTVSIFLECDMNLSLAAKKLHLHRNTLIYRLDKIKKTIGLDPRKFSDAIQIKLGVLLYGPSIRCQ